MNIYIYISYIIIILGLRIPRNIEFKWNGPFLNGVYLQKGIRNETYLFFQQCGYFVQATEILKVTAASANRLHVVASILELT